MYDDVNDDNDYDAPDDDADGCNDDADNLNKIK